MARRSEYTMDPKDLDARKRKEKTIADKANQSISEGRQITEIKRILSDWGNILNNNGGIGIHNNFEHEHTL